jgi:hypothetical protein
MSDEPIRRVGDTVHHLSLTGHVIAWHDGEPVLVGMPGTEDQFLPVFSSVDNLRDLLTGIAVAFSAIKRIDSGNEFIASLPLHLASGQRLRIIVDPYWTEAGRVRFIEVQRDT